MGSLTMSARDSETKTQAELLREVAYHLRGTDCPLSVPEAFDVAAALLERIDEALGKAEPTFSDFIRGDDKEEVMLKVLDKVQREQSLVLERAAQVAELEKAELAKLTVPHWKDPYTNNGDRRHDTDYRHGWNDCRDAMLAGYSR